MESYRSGHNGAVLKTVRAQVHRGSNPLLSATIKGFTCETDEAFNYVFTQIFLQKKPVLTIIKFTDFLIITGRKWLYIRG